MEESSPLFAHLFSSPLVQRDGDKDKLLAVEPLEHPAERRALLLLLRRSDWVDLRWRSDPCRVTSFLEAYTTSKILHFTGHGEKGALAFENNVGMLQWVTNDELYEMCKDLEDKPEVVFLSACYGVTCAHTLVDLGIPHIITVTSDRVLDQASLEFTDAFYSALFAGKSVLSSFQLGIARLVAQFPTEKDKFQLLGGESDGAHNEKLFGHPSSPLDRPHLDATEEARPPSQCYSSAMFSLGRNLLIQEVYGLLMNGVKIINLTGPKGIGKSEVALKVAEYAQERSNYSRLLYIDFRKLDSQVENSCLAKLISSFSMKPSNDRNTHLSSVFSFDNDQNNVEGTVEFIRRSFLSPNEQILLLLDGVDNWLIHNRLFLQDLVCHLYNRLGDVLSIIMTSVVRLEVDVSREVPVDGLSDAAAARLFAFRVPRQLDNDELYLDSYPNLDPIKAFARSKLLQSMKGNCKVVELVAKELLFDGQPQHLLRYETYIREEVIPNLSQLVQIHGSPKTWSEVKTCLVAAYRRALGIETCRARPLRVADFDFFASCRSWGLESFRPAENGYHIHAEAFESFMVWFEDVLLALRGSQLWDKPHCIHGFTSRQEAATLLASCDVGTFLVGVSQSEACLVINVVSSPGSVLPVKIKFTTQSPTPFSYNMRHGMSSSFSSLEELIHCTPLLTHFFLKRSPTGEVSSMPKEALLQKI